MYKGLSGNDLLAALATDATVLREKLKAWKAAEQKIVARQPNRHLAERLIRLGAKDQEANLESTRSGRTLLADPDPVPPLMAAASDALRVKLDAAHAAWEAAWKKGDERLGNDATWAKLSPEQKHSIRQDCWLADGHEAFRGHAQVDCRCLGAARALRVGERGQGATSPHRRCARHRRSAVRAQSAHRFATRRDGEVGSRARPVANQGPRQDRRGTGRWSRDSEGVKK